MPGRRWRGRAALAAALLATALSAAGEPARADAAPPLPALCIDASTVTVSGVSSGGFLAHQLHVARSRSIAGAGIFAAGPYACAGTRYPASLFRALTICSDFPDLVPFLGPPDAERSIRAARSAEDAGAIDPVSGLAGDPVLLFSGRKDALVPSAVVSTTGEFYRAFGSGTVTFVDTVDASHAMVTPMFGNPCDAVEPPFINACGFDLAGATLQHLTGPLQPPAPPDGRILAFDQRAFVDRNRTHGLANTGFLYVPQGCSAAAGCRLHIALHGCRQSADLIGDAFYRNAGYNTWAEANRIIVLYPQAAALTTRFLGIDLPWPNPQGCWDWWGFTGDDYATHTGPQIAALAAMIGRLAGSAAVSGSSAPGSSCDPAGGG